jgi:2,5-diketo-D-gluconate reductase B
MGIEEPEPVTTALEIGYRHLDTARIYENEEIVGEGLAAASVPHEDVFLATKLWIDDLAPDDVIESAKQSLTRLDVEYVDLCYVHRPRGAYDPEGTLDAFCRLVEEGLIHQVGVSNFSVSQVDDALERLDASLYCHQTELHPLFQRPDLVAHAQEYDYTLVAYAPLAGGRVFEIPELDEIAEKHGTSAAAVAIAWLIGMDNVVTIPKASSRAHLEANLAARELNLDREDRARIEGIDHEQELFSE